MNADIKAIKERCDKATPGPWIWDIRKNDKHVMLRSTVGLRNIVMDFIRWGTQSATPRFIVDGIMKVAALFAKSIPGCEHHTGFDDYIDHPDADFIAHSRTDVENMVADIESLQAQLESSRERERAAVRDMTHIANAIAVCRELLADGTGRVSSLKLGRCAVCKETCHDGNPCKFEWRGPAGEGERE